MLATSATTVLKVTEPEVRAPAQAIPQATVESNIGRMREFLAQRQPQLQPW
jgi:hypothetical protein